MTERPDLRPAAHAKLLTSLGKPTRKIANARDRSLASWLDYFVPSFFAAFFFFFFFFIAMAAIL
jgi:hypothetical protein